MTQDLAQHEQFFDCPYCGERISMLLDTSVDHQTYVEDCEVCCRPIELDVTLGAEGLNITTQRGDE